MVVWNLCPAVERNPDKVSGAWLFRGTRVPISSLFENLRDGATVEQFPSVDDGLNPRLFAFLGARDLGGGVVDGFMFPMN